jgi:hypothetical protein
MIGDSLADQSARRRLVLFIGAGISTSAGLPTWQGLLSGLAVDAGFDPDERRALEDLPAVDQARLIRDRLERTTTDAKIGGPLAAAICERVNGDRYGLSHALLASLPVVEVITTNYDTLFETASWDAEYSTAILPYESTEERSRWLLKMHGCVEHPADIVLTREDYLRYAERRGALAAIVQAMLITRHMLFVGFSLNDDNFQRIADEVRKVMRTRPSDSSTGSEPFGTALLLNSSDLLASLWQKDIRCVSIGRGSDQPTSAAANELEVLLDYVLYRAQRNVGHLMDRRYAGLLSTEEKQLRDLLVRLEADATPAMRRLPAWRPVADMLAELGTDSTRDTRAGSGRSREREDHS